MLDWKKRCRKDSTLVSDRKIWETKCGTYKVIFSQIRYGRGLDGIPDTYYAIYKDEEDGEEIISKHRKMSTAMKACEKDSGKKDE
jgi:hypothetical protein